ncbi:MAG: hypothetical protein HYY04_13550 [Chloroflexi bacterium]|nr:hypothetical protein [Chloroflexota bacterium]
MTTTPAPDTVALLARATVYLHLAQALAYPTDRRLAELWSNRFVEVLGAAVGALDEVGSLEAALDQLKQAIAMLRDSSPGLPEEHTCLFARQVQAAPYETSYGRDFAFGRMRELEEVAAYYAAFGLRISPGPPRAARPPGCRA